MLREIENVTVRAHTICDYSRHYPTSAPNLAFHISFLNKLIFHRGTLLATGWHNCSPVINDWLR
jgi:hypothetical protein